MRKCQGITESIWANMPEDKRVSWKYLSRGVVLIGTLFVTKTGVAYLDWTVAAVTAIFLLIFIESQRAYSKLSPRLRKNSVRVAVFLGTWSIVVLGMAYFLQAAIISAATVFSKDIVPNLDKWSSALIQFFSVLMFLFAFPVAIIKVFRNLQFEELIYKLPKRGLVQLLVKKQPKATTFSQFAVIELSVMLLCLLYASALAEIAKVFLKLFAVLL